MWCIMTEITLKQECCENMSNIESTGDDKMTFNSSSSRYSSYRKSSAAETEGRSIRHNQWIRRSYLVDDFIFPRNSSESSKKAKATRQLNSSDHTEQLQASVEWKAERSKVHYNCRINLNVISQTNVRSVGCTLALYFIVQRQCRWQGMSWSTVCLWPVQNVVTISMESCTVWSMPVSDALN